MGTKIKTPIDYDIVKEVINNSGFEAVGKASIREIKFLINQIENKTGERFVRMEMGIPGFSAPQIAIDAEKKALDEGCASMYPDIDGIPELKNEISRFVKNFIDIDIDPQYCLSTVGSIHGNFATFMVAGRMDEKKDTVLFLDPGFPVHKALVKMLGLKTESFDVYNYRGQKLKARLEEYLAKGNISTILYSNPNNPSWICFTEEELQIIGELATKYDVVVEEDLAYFAMDFRSDLSKPGVAPFQPSVAKYTDNYILMISSSKAFSYAGQRVGMMCISEKLFKSNHENLLKYYSSANFGHSVAYGTVYASTAGVTHSAQKGLAALLKATNDGDYNPWDVARKYGDRAKKAKELFIDNGFHIVYDTDIDKPIADGFYFTIAYPGFEGYQLVEELMYYGISAISLSGTGSERTEGLRACVSFIADDQFPALEERLKAFKANH
ncbi:MAG: pyridoxal phosphate-dependent aminotransferase [Bacteroidales bacterium]|nr:pyridoxal phosphate-dependent aminotransferase [Bacteroidales bacterium]